MSIVDILSKNEKKRRDTLNEILNKVSEGTLATTAPFRKGANILAQNYASAFTGKDMSKSENQGAFLKYLAGAITPEEQKQILDKPFLEAVKSSAGMTSTLMPFTKIGSIANVGVKAVNPTISKLAQLATRGGIEGTVGGFGYSRPGKEIQDTLLGTMIGAGGEVLGGLVSDPTFRKGMGREFIKANSGKYEAMLNLAKKERVLDMSKTSDKQYLINMFGEDGAASIIKNGTYKGRDISNRLSEMGIKIINGGAEEVLDTINPTGNIITEYNPKKRATIKLGKNITTLADSMGESPDKVITVYRGVPKNQKILNAGDFITTNYDLAQSYTGDGNIIAQKVKLGDILDDVTDPLGEEYIYRPGAYSEIGLTKIIKLANAEDIPNTYSNMLKKISQNSNGRQTNFARVIDEALSEGNRGERFISTEKLPEAPRVSSGLGGKKTYSKQAMLAKRSKTAKRIPISSWNADILEELKSKRK